MGNLICYKIQYSITQKAMVSYHFFVDSGAVSWNGTRYANLHRNENLTLHSLVKKRNSVL